MKIVVVGSVAFDSVETPWGKADDALGGSATYFSMAASYFAPVHLVAVVGEDLPSHVTEMLEAKGVDLQGLERVAGKTFRWGGRYREDMNQRDTLFTELNVFEHFHPKVPAAYHDAELVFLANIHPSLQQEVLDQIHRPKLVALDTMNLWIETAQSDLAKVLSHVDLLFLNDEEARQLSGENSLLRAVRKVQKMGPSKVVVKKGEHGALLFDGETAFSVPAMLLDRVYDPTGAGDSFAGGFLGYLAKNGDLGTDALRRAMGYGTVLASFVTEQFSIDRLISLSDEDIDGRLLELRELTRWPA